MLYVDDRERAVFEHFPSCITKIKYKQHRLEMGDYALVDTESNRIIAVFERKTLADYVTSLKDSRALNKYKMIKAREQDQAVIFYIVEGNPFNDPNRLVAKMPFRYIESSIFHLMMFDNIHVLWSRGTKETAQLLERFCVSYFNKITRERAKLPVVPKGFIGGGPAEQSAGDQPAQSAVGIPMSSDVLTQNTVDIPPADDAIGEVPNVADDGEKVPEEISSEGSAIQEDAQEHIPHLLVARGEITTLDVVREMWACFKYITSESADYFASRFRIIDIIKGLVDVATMDLHTDAGRKLGSNIIASLKFSTEGRRRTRAEIETNILACVKGLSRARAEKITQRYSLGELYDMGAEKIAKVKPDNRELGVLGERIYSALVYIKPHPAN